MSNKRADAVISGLMATVAVGVCFTVLIFSQWPDQYLHIITCDVGQGDAILLSQGFTQLLVDAGLKDEAVLRCLRNYLPFWDRRIEWIVATHMDADHIGGFAGILDRFTVQTMILAPDAKKTADFERFEAAVLQEQSTGSRVLTPVTGALIPVAPGWKLSVLNAPSDSSDAASRENKVTTEAQLWDVKIKAQQPLLDSNNRSIVLSLQYGQVSVLLMGDAEIPLEQALLDERLVTHHTILKVGHHGSKSSSQETFLRTVRPEIALVSAGKNNRYGHPSPQILQRLQAFGVAQILRTDELGTIELQTDGQTVWQVPQ